MMRTALVCAVLLLIGCFALPSVAGQNNVSYPSCTQFGTPANSAPPIACAFSGLQCPAINTTSQMLPGTCGAFLAPYGGMGCSPQINDLYFNMLILAQDFGECPACLANFWTLFCAFTCSPYQGAFTRVTSYVNSSGTLLVGGITFDVHQDFVDGLYASCAGSSFNGISVGQQWPNGKALLDYIAGQSKIEIILYNVSTAPTAFNAPTVPCNLMCPCARCPSACPIANSNVTRCEYTLLGNTWTCLSLALSASYAVFFTAVVLISAFILPRLLRWLPLVQWTLPPLMAVLIAGAAVLWYFMAPRCNYSIGPVQISCVAFAYVCLYGGITALVFIFVMIKSHMRQARKPVASSTSLSPQSSAVTLMQGSQTGMLRHYWRAHGRFVARYSVGILMATAVLVCLCTLVGIRFLKIEQDPVKLWVSPNSRTAVDQDYFNKAFGAFYRVEQLIITTNTSVPGGESGNVTQAAVLLQALALQQHLQEAIGVYQVGNETFSVTFDDLCFRPVYGQGCLIESPLEWWQSNASAILATNRTGDYFNACGQVPLNCMSSIGTPIDANVVLGGYPGQAYSNATALIITMLLNNNPNTTVAAEAWELNFLQRIETVISTNAYPLLNISYSAQDELSRETDTDVKTVVISYVAMFLYVSVALGSLWPLSFGSLFVRSKFLLGLSGVLVVLCSLTFSVAINALLGIKATLIISEVIPFLVLAIGVDNIFILVNTFEQTPEDLPSTERLAETLAEVGSSITLASVTEAVAFLLGSFTRMPAVQAFAFYSSVAIIFDLILQVTAFSAILVLDSKRRQSSRLDCVPCIRISGGASVWQLRNQEGLVKRFIRTHYAPALFHPLLKILVVLGFVGLFVASIGMSPQLQVGLDQRVALPRDSYLVTYFNEMDQYLEVGPPMYVVMRGPLDYTNATVQNQLCSITNCSGVSVVNLFAAANYVQPPPYFWLDDYTNWVTTPDCSSCYPNGTMCASGSSDPNCQLCAQLDPDTGRPVPDQFMQYLPDFLNFTVKPSCALTGIGYPTDISFSTNSSGIYASRIRLYHTVLKTQEDYIQALRVAYEVADQTGLSVFPYSVFYVYFEQYLGIQTIAAVVVGLALLGVFLVSLLLLHDPWLSFLVVATVSMIVMDLVGVMRLWNISLNAVSVTNLVMSIGISIEFCIHIVNAFSHAQGTHEERASRALVDMGSSVFSGITLTKFCGVIVLAFSSSDIFVVYYFRMYLAMVLLGALHGLMFLPILLSLVGTPLGLWEWLRRKVCGDPGYEQIN